MRARIDEERRPARALGVVEEEDVVLRTSELSASYGSQVVVHDVSLTVRTRECLALVGESGSGKSTLAKAIVGIHPNFAGELSFEGSPLAKNGRDRDRATRRRLQYVFQNPYGSLNPRRTIGQNVAQPLQLFFDLPRKEIQGRVADALERVAMGASAMSRYPDQLSGGERQRVAIARALGCQPSLLICDEITSALDVSVQAAIIDLLHELQRDMGLAMLFVTHNLPLVRTIAQRVAVMTEGRIVEVGPSQRVMDAPEAEYTRQLLADSPVIEQR
jgi:peptide/nickel transport system ATP-binding protein